ncbi:MAG: ATP-binding protein [Bacilli bacterium]
MIEEDDFNVELCCWKNVCGIRNSSKCCSTCPRYTKMNYLLRNSLLPEYWWYPKNFDTFTDHVDYNAHLRCFEIKNNILDFVKEGKQLIIYGKNSGSGKTHISTRLLLSYFAKIWELTSFRPRALFIDVQKLFIESNKYDSEYNKFINANYTDVDLIVWDDIGVEDQLDSKQNKVLFTMINEREMNGKANIFTTNKNQAELYNYFGERLYSRIVRPAEFIEFKSDDNRRLKA